MGQRRNAIRLVGSSSPGFLELGEGRLEADLVAEKISAELGAALRSRGSLLRHT
jgi:hypothetical protein